MLESGAALTVLAKPPVLYQPVSWAWFAKAFVVCSRDCQHPKLHTVSNTHGAQSIRTHQNKPDPLGMLLRVKVLNFDTDTLASAAAS